MDLLSSRSEDDVLKGRFVRKVLSEAAKDIDQAQRQLMSERGFESADWNDRQFVVSDTSLEYTHLKKHRFVDMRTREKDGAKRPKKSHPVHNRIIFGHYNNIIRELTVGFTQEVRDQIKKSGID